MKLALGLMFFVAFIALGKSYASRFTSRKNFFANFNTFNNCMINEMAFSKRTLVEIEEKLNFNSQFGILLKSFISQSPSPDLSGLLTADELNFTQSYFALLGKSHSASQLEMCKAASAQLQEMATQSSQKAIKYRTLLTRLGALFGLLALIIIV